MKVSVEDCTKTVTIVKWTVGLPRLQHYVQSSSFMLYGDKFYLVMDSSIEDSSFARSKSNCVEYWTMALVREEKGNLQHPNFPIRVYIQDKGTHLYMSQEEFSEKKTTIWASSCTNFKDKYPNIRITGTELEFVLEFIREVLEEKFLFKEKESVEKEAEVREKYLQLASLNNLSLDLQKLMEDDSHSDVQLKCGDLSVGAHKLILGARSEVFRNMMKSKMKESQQGVIKIVDMEPKILEVFLKYIYTGILPDLAEDTAVSLYEAADKYQIESLKTRCGHFMEESVSPDNALRFLVVADAHSHIALKSRLVSYIVRKKIPSREEEWLKFCDEYPKLANEVLNLSYKLTMK